MVETIVFVASGALLGFLIGLTGVGGGVLTVPTLILVMEFEPIAAVGTASLYAVLAKIWAAIQHYRQGTINLEVGIRFFAATIPGVILGSVAVKWSKVSLPPSGVEALQNAVSYIVIFSIAFSLVALLFDYRRVENKFADSSKATLLKFSCLFLVGVVMGLTSIGGGILIIPALLLFYRETTRYVGTSIFVAVLSMAVMAALYGFIGRGRNIGDVDLNIAALMALGSLVGTHYGATLSKRMQPRRLKAFVISVIILAAAMMIADRML
jgi:uncharacterized protein